MIDVYVSGLTIDCGRQGENLARNIIFELQSLIDTYGEGTATLVCMRPSDKVPYVCETTQDDAVLTWTPSATDTAYPGAGKCELRWVVGETLAKSIIYTTTIAPSITGAEGVPSPYKSWYDAIIAYIEANYAANGAPQEVREAIYTLLSKAAYTETGLTDELAIVQAWAAEPPSVTNNLTHVTNSNTATMLEQGASYTGTLTADTGYTLGSVTVTMGGVDITATVYSSGTITIPSVTGDIVITATAVVAVASLSAVYTQSGTVYDTYVLDTLKADLVVTATYSDSSTATIPSTDYTLSGTLEAGTSTITVSYGGKTATFNVTVTEYSTAPVIATEGVVWSKDAPSTKTANGFGITQWYPYSFSQETLESSRYWDATNGYMTTNGWSGLKVCTPDWNTYNAGYSWPASSNYKNVTGKDNVYVRYYSITRNALGTVSFIRNSTTAIEDNCASFSIPLLDKDYSYAYWMPTNGNLIYPDGVSSGDIIFAGRYTPYYGLNNIMEAPDLSSISAVFTQGDTVVTESTTLNSLKTMLEVTALYDNNKTLPVNLGLVTLSGTLTEGTSTITATYENKTATFNVTVTAG